jgi:hypothetical protein
MTCKRNKSSPQFNLYLSSRRRELLDWAQKWGNEREVPITPSEVIELALKRLRESEDPEAVKERK